MDESLSKNLDSYRIETESVENRTVSGFITRMLDEADSVFCFKRSIPRSNGKSRSVYYARFLDDLGHIVRTKVLGAESRKDAYLEAQNFSILRV
jgi:hypothetical protein